MTSAVADGKRSAEIEASQILMKARQEAEDIVDADKEESEFNSKIPAG